MMKFLRLFVLLSLTFLTNCSAQTSSDVYLSLEKDYPESKYLVAIGEGDTRREAEKNASAKLALIFESNIDVNETLNEFYSEFSDDESSSLNYEATTKKRTNIESNQKLLNVKYGKHSVDELGNTFVVAYINRRETANIYDEKIENLHSSILALEENANRTDVKIKKYAALNRASKLMNENMELMKQLTIISPYNPDFSDKIEKYNSIYSSKGKVASSISFVISNESDKDIINALSSLLTSNGFKIADNGDFIVTTSLKYDEVDLGRKEEFYNWYMNVELKNTNEEVIFNFEKSGREGGMSKSAALARAKHSASSAIKKEFVKGFEKYLDSLLGR